MGNQKHASSKMKLHQSPVISGPPFPLPSAAPFQPPSLSSGYPPPQLSETGNQRIRPFSLFRPGFFGGTPKPWGRFQPSRLHDEKSGARKSGEKNPSRATRDQKAEAGLPAPGLQALRRGWLGAPGWQGLDSNPSSIGSAGELGWVGGGNGLGPP